MKKNRVSLLLATFALLAGNIALAADEPPAVSHDGLALVQDSAADIAYRLPEADFSIYKRVMIMEPGVAFRKNWDRDYNRNATRKVRESDMERIKAGMAELFLEVFTEDLEKAGYPVVEEVGDDVLLLRPAIINLDVTAPELNSTGRSRAYVASAGSATLYIEFYDSVSGQILARAADFKKATDWGNFQWANGVSNRREARIIVRKWADMLVSRLNEVHGKTN